MTAENMTTLPPDLIRITHSNQTKKLAYIAIGKSKAGHCIAFGIKAHDWAYLINQYLYIAQSQLKRLDDVLESVFIVNCRLLPAMPKLLDSLNTALTDEAVNALSLPNLPAKQGFYWRLNSSIRERFIFNSDLVTKSPTDDGMMMLTQCKEYGNHAITIVMQNGYQPLTWVSDGFGAWVINTIYKNSQQLSTMMNNPLAYALLSLTDNPKHAKFIKDNLNNIKPIGGVIYE